MIASGGHVPPNAESEGTLSAAAGRGLLLIMLAVGLGVLLLSRGLDDTGILTDAGGKTSANEATQSTAQVNGTSTTAAAVPATSTTLPAVPRNPAEVKVLVANASGTQFKARANVDALKPLGYNTLQPDNYSTLKTAEAPEIAETSSVYFADGWEVEARGVASALGIPVEAVVPLGATPVLDSKDASVVVVLGRDGLGVKPS